MMPQTCPGSVISPCRVRSQRRLVALLVSLALSVGVSIGAQAATTWTVCASGCDYASIKAAIAAPTTLDGDTLAIAAGTYTELNIVVDKSLTLQGEGRGKTIVQAAATPDEATDRVFTIPSGVTVTLQDLMIRYGHTQRGIDAGGGGIFNAGTLTLTASTVRDNKVTNTLSGGGLYNAGTLTLTHSTVSGNTARHRGGGLSNEYAPLSLTASTVSNNTATEGGGLYHNVGLLALTNSIIANHPSARDCVINGTSIPSTGYTLDSDGSCWLTAATDRPGVDPLLGPLQDNGGPTLTHALLPGSPAIDGIPWGTNGCGTSHISDQRWQARPQPAWGACDSGAYEAAVDGQPLSAWVTGMTLRTVVCQNVTTGQEVTLSAPVPPWDCEAAGFAITSGDRVALRVRGPVQRTATDVGVAVAGMTPSCGSCTNVTTGQQVTFPYTSGATTASCGAAGLVVQAGEAVQMRVQGGAE
jgi:hypothetical protein